MMETKMQNQMEVVEHLFDENIRLTGITDFGLRLEELLQDQSIMPPQGARFDIAFEGSVNGPKRDIDYLEIRPDGKLMLTMYAVIATDEMISVYEDGINTLSGNGSPIGELSLNMRLHTSSQKYSWVNKIQVWCKGYVDMAKGEARVSAFRS